ncbi:MAG: nicotinate-nucleotide adenylyltransferase [Hyphomonadaceae bacterium]
MRRFFPLAYPPMRVGLLGGTFDPAHFGHAHVAEIAAQRLELDRVWWLVTPQNPLKPRAAPLSERMQSARAIAHGPRARAPRMIVSDIETRLGVSFTADTLRALRRLYPGVRFVLLLGADNLNTFHRWRRWREILREIPIAIVSRPGESMGAAAKARLAQSFRLFPQSRLPAHAARALPGRKAPAWVYLPAPFANISSTKLRRGKAARHGAEARAMLS